MQGRRIFYLTPHGLSIFIAQKVGMCIHASFSTTSEGVSGFADYLALQPDYPSSLLIDLIEEEYRHESIPHVGTRDRKDLLDRRLDQHYRRTPYRCAMVQGRQPSGRRDDVVLLTALINPDAMSIWLAELGKHKVPLKGIYSTPMVTGKLLNKLGAKHDNILLLSMQCENLLRLSFFEGNQLKMSRLLPMAFSDPGSYAANVQLELEKNHRYLNRLRLLPHGAPMHVYILTGQEYLTQLRNDCKDSDVLHYHLVDLNDVAYKIGLEIPLAANQSEWLYVYLLNRDAPAANYASINERRYHVLHEMRTGTIAASVLLALTAAGWSISATLEGRQSLQQVAAASTLADQMERSYEQTASSLPSVSVIPQNLRAAVEISRKLENNKTSPIKILSALGRALTAYPQIQVDEIRWREATGVDAAMDDQGIAEDMPGEGDQLLQIGVLKARLQPQSRDYSAVFAQIDDFIKDLRRDPRIIDVRILSMPLNVNPALVLSGEAGSNAPATDAVFEIKAIMRDESHGG